MANAQEVISQLTNTWTSMLDKFYDSVAEEYLLWMSKEYKIDIKILREKAAPLKEKLLNKATHSISSVKTTKKPINVKIQDPSKYGAMDRKQLIGFCKERQLPIKRKNQDMIDALKKFDSDNDEASTSKQAGNNIDDDSDEEHESPAQISNTNQKNKKKVKFDQHIEEADSANKNILNSEEDSSFESDSDAEPDPPASPKLKKPNNKHAKQHLKKEETVTVEELMEESMESDDED